MQRCIQLAELGAGFTAPNPMVGAVLVYENRIIGEGWHQQYGGPHAEVNCVNSVSENDKDLIAQSTIYVSLEPCAHYGKTPPCAQFIIEHKIPKVVVGCSDSFDQVNGKGIQMLKDAGIEVIMPVLEQECIALNSVFFTYHHKKRPFVLLKWAQTKDGFIAPKNTGNVAISNSLVKVLVHQWRSVYQAIGVGFNTVVLDNPQLNNRLWPNGQQPIRVILDPKNELPCDKQIFDGEQTTFIYNAHFSMNAEVTQWIKVPETDFIQHVLQDLYERKITSIMIEGGAKTLQLFIDAQLYDAIFMIESEQTLEDGVQAPVIPNAKHHQQQQLADNTIHYFYYD